MKGIIFGFLATLLLGSCNEPEKYGFVDNGKVINGYQEKIDIEEKYKAKELAFNQRTDSIGKAFQLEAQDYQIKAQKMSATKAQELYGELMQKQQLLQQQIQFEQQQIQQSLNVELDSVITKIKSYVNKYGDDNGYDYIFGTSETTNSVLFGKIENDLSQVIIDGLNLDYSKKQ